MSEEEFFYKKSLVNGEVYMQIWKDTPNGKKEYVASLGNANKAHHLLVKVEELTAQTKKNASMLTKMLNGEAPGSD